MPNALTEKRPVPIRQKKVCHARCKRKKKNRLLCSYSAPSERCLITDSDKQGYQHLRRAGSQYGFGNCTAQCSHCSRPRSIQGVSKNCIGTQANPQDCCNNNNNDRYDTNEYETIGRRCQSTSVKSNGEMNSFSRQQSPHVCNAKPRVESAYAGLRPPTPFTCARPCSAFHRYMSQPPVGRTVPQCKSRSTECPSRSVARSCSPKQGFQRTWPTESTRKKKYVKKSPRPANTMRMPAPRCTCAEDYENEFASKLLRFINIRKF